MSTKHILLNPLIPLLVGAACAGLAVTLVTCWLDWDNLTYGPHYYWAQVRLYGWPEVTAWRATALMWLQILLS